MDTAKIELLGIDRVLRRGTGEIVERREGALLVYDSVSGAYMLGCEDPEAGAEVLRRDLKSDCRLLMVSDRSLGSETFGRYGFCGMMECRQAAYYGPEPVLSGNLAIREAREEDLAMLTASYDLVSADEMRRIVERKKLVIGSEGGRTVGFAGEHLEGSMGLLYVFPEYRRRGYACELEKAVLLRTMREGFVPFGQVEKSNAASLALQRKLGLAISGDLICWMWK